MTAIAGIDPSTKTIGLATPDGNLFSLHPHAGPGDRGRRLDELDRELERAIRTFPPIPWLVVLEGPSLHSPGTLGKIRQAEVRGVILRRLYLLEIGVVEIAPSALKKFATGNGNASKDAMIAAAVAAGGRPLNDDEADAFHLRRMGLAAYGHVYADEEDVEAIRSLTEWPTRRDAR